MTFLLILMGFVVGFFAYPIAKAIFGFHECDYEVLFNRCIDDLPIGCRYGVSGSEIRNGFKVDTSLVWVSYKKCRKCGHVKVAVSNGTDREFHYDAEHVQTIIEAIMKREKDAADKALLERTNERLVRPFVGDLDENLVRLQEKLGA